MRNSSVKNLIIALIALLVFAVAATVVYVYVIAPIIDNGGIDIPGPDDPDLTDDPDGITITKNDTTYADGDKCYFTEGVNTFALSHLGATVTISANPDCNFDYSVNDQIYRWSALTDLSTVVSLSVSSDSFSIALPDGDTVEALIARAHATTTDTVELLSSLPNSAPLFRITVTVGDQTATLTAAYGFDLDYIELDQSQIIFG